MSSNIQHTDISLQELKNNIERGLYCIPKFQRNFVWKKTDIESLGDSLIRGYPVSSILLMPMNGTLNIGATNLNTLQSVTGDQNHSIYVLDGQQRITSIARIFANLDDKNQYFFDLLSILCESFPNDNLQRFLDKHKHSSILSEMYCRSFPLPSTKEICSHKQNYRFIAAKEVIEGRFASIINNYLLKTLELSDEKYDEYLNYLSALFGQVGKYGIAQTMIEGNAELGLVCRVFEKVNSSGKKLTTFDLINAKSFQTNNDNYKEGLSDYLTHSLNKITSNKNPALVSSIESFFEYDSKTCSYGNLGRIARILFLISCFNHNNPPLLTNSTMLAMESDAWFALWDDNKDIIVKCVQYFYTESYQKFTPITYLEYIISIICASPESFNRPLFLTTVKKYALKLGVENQSFTKTNLDVVDQFYRLSRDILVSQEKNLTLPSTKASVNVEDFRTSKPNNFRFEAAYNIMTKEHYKGKFTLDLNNISLCAGKTQIDQHHFFPKALSKNEKDPIYNSIANIVPLNSQTNRYDIKDKEPLVFYRELNDKLQSSEKVSSLLESNLIPESFLKDQSTFDSKTFLEARLVLVTEYINDFFSGK